MEKIKRLLLFYYVIFSTIIFPFTEEWVKCIKPDRIWTHILSLWTLQQSEQFLRIVENFISTFFTEFGHSLKLVGAFTLSLSSTKLSKSFFLFHGLPLPYVLSPILACNFFFINLSSATLLVHAILIGFHLSDFQTSFSPHMPLSFFHSLPLCSFNPYYRAQDFHIHCCLPLCTQTN